ncbi:MAG: MBL fold metallo-hydrolase [Verrucomicrobiota bacterium]|nr:MBL fold metallo-hydrolase [Verrucomicrobiota bacterium]
MIHVLDTRQLDRPGIIAATAVETDDSLVFFDTGAESTFNNIAAELQGIGARPEDVRHVFLSHIHFDHAGAAWRFAELGATIYVHPRGAKHLIDPTKLIDSATRIFGDEMERLWGRIAPVPQEKLKILQDGEVTRVGDVAIRAIETAGHATHHHVYHWEDNLFGGDVAGVRLGSGPVIPPFVPPELQIEAWLESIDKMRALHATALYLPHFGKVTADLASHFDALEQRVRRWATWFRDRLRAGDDEAQIIPQFSAYELEELLRDGAREEQWPDYEAADPSFMAVPAAARYWRKYHADEIGVLA